MLVSHTHHNAEHAGSVSRRGDRSDSSDTVGPITQNGQAAMVVMSPERYDFLVHSAERGHIWREAIRAHRAGEPGIPARDAIRSVAEELGLEL